MPRSTDRIVTTHAGSLPRPDDVVEMIWGGIEGKPVDRQALDARLDEAVADVVRKQREAGVDLVSDGELNKPRENVIAGTDCGFDTFIRFSQVEPDVVWLKLQALSEGAAMASEELWAKSAA